MRKFRIGAIFFSAPLNFAAPFCFDHNFFIGTPFWVILVSLENLESVESKYILKEHFLNYYEGLIFRMLQLVTFFSLLFS